MLTNLVKKIVAEDNKRLERRLLIEGALIQKNMFNVKRYSLLEDCCEDGITNSFDVDSLAMLLSKVTFEDTDTEEDKKEKLHALTVKTTPLNELTNESIEMICKDPKDKKSEKMVTMTLEDFTIVHDAIMNYYKNNSEKNNEDRIKITKFIKTIDKMLQKVINENNKNIAKDSGSTQNTNNPFDSYINSAIDTLYKKINNSVTLPKEYEHETPLAVLKYKINFIVRHM